MNKRIRELAEQTKLWDRLDPRYLGLDGGWLSTEKYWGEELQEFAELIVQECINAIDDGDGSMSSMAESCWRSRCMKEIKQHFGVEK